jgi:hypothetical protein
MQSVGVKPSRLLVLMLLAAYAHAQSSYDFTLSNPNPCGVGCMAITGSGEFTVTGSAISAWSATINGQPLNLVSGLFNTTAMPSSASSPWTISSLMFPYAMNVVPWSCSGCVAFDKAPPTPGSTLIWYAPVLFTVKRITSPPLSSGGGPPPPFRQAASSPNIARANLGLEIGAPVAAALVTWIIRHEWNRHREALPAGSAKF